MQHLLRNQQTMSASSVIPVLQYPDVEKAIHWLCTTFGFTERWRAGNHRAQLAFGNGAIVITQLSATHNNTNTCSLMVRVEDVDSHFLHASENKAEIISPPETFPYGEKQYSAVDLGGYVWMFSESVADVNVEDWGGTLPK